MQRKKLLTAMSLPIVLAVAGCGGSGGDGVPPTAPTPASTYSVTLTAIELDRSADQQDMPVTGLPADGATLTVQ